LLSTSSLTFFEYQLPVLVWLMTMFLFSTDAFSSNETSKIIVPALTYLFPKLSPHQIDFWHLFIRKCGHISEYFILTVLAFRSFEYEEIDPLDTRFRTMTFVLMAALLDEWHQSFTASRGASIVDVGYDCVGGVLALWLITAYETWRLRSHSVL
jgi:VanZ family protein